MKYVQVFARRVPHFLSDPAREDLTAYVSAIANVTVFSEVFKRKKKLEQFEVNYLLSVKLPSRVDRVNYLNLDGPSSENLLAAVLTVPLVETEGLKILGFPDSSPVEPTAQIGMHDGSAVGGFGFRGTR